MRIGINASFLRKPGTGIGQVSVNFIDELMKFTGPRIKDQESEGNPQSSILNSRFILYTEEPVSFSMPSNFENKYFLPFWRRDDLIRKLLWEKRVMREAQKDACDAFISLYQSSTVMPKSIHHTMVVHDIIPRLFPEYQGNTRQKWYWKATEKGIRGADRIVAVSESTRHDLKETGLREDAVTVAYPDTGPLFKKELVLEEENRVMAEYHLVPGYIYHGGGLEVRKNAESLLRAYALLVEKEKNETLGASLPLLVISGKIFPEDNPLATPVRKLVRELGLEERVRLLGFVPEQDLPALYRNALFFVYPSLYEGFGLPVLEALRMGTPVLTVENSSLPEVAGGVALYIDPHHVESLVSGMEQLLRDALLRQTLSDAASKQVKRFSEDHFVRSVLGSLEEKPL